MKKYLAFFIGLGMLGSTRAWAQPAARLGTPRPAATLGAPTAAIKPVSFTVRAASPDPLIGDYIPAARLGPISEVRYGPDTTPAAPPTPQERYNWGIRDPFEPAPMRASPASQSLFGEKLGDLFDSNGQGQGHGHGEGWGHFESDHCFDDFISPVSNPFLNEDPRALTELRPIFMYQTIPNSGNLHGGNAEWFGLQARLAVTQRLSIVMSKLGGVWVNPGSGSITDGGSSFSEFWIGPKYTWYRDDQSGTLSAAGLIFQIPTGSAHAYQNTAGLSLTPYINVAQKFGKTSYGSFNVMNTLGGSFATSTQRSNYVYDSLHVDFDVANYNRIFPLIELNWIEYVRNGTARNLGFEGQDLANVGTTPSNHAFLSVAFGARYKVSEAIQFGLAASFPLTSAHDLQGFRLTVDMIWRY